MQPGDLYIGKTKQPLRKWMAQHRGANSLGQDSAVNLHLKKKKHSSEDNNVHILPEKRDLVWKRHKRNLCQAAMTIFEWKELAYDATYCGGRLRGWPASWYYWGANKPSWEFHPRNNILASDQNRYSKAQRFAILWGKRCGSIKQEFFILNEHHTNKRPVNTT